MKPGITIALSIAGIMAAIATSIANANGVFSGHRRLHYWFYGASLSLIGTAIVGWVVSALREKNADMATDEPKLAWFSLERPQQIHSYIPPSFSIGTAVRVSSGSYDSIQWYRGTA